MVRWHILRFISQLFYTHFAFLFDPILRLTLRGGWISWQLEIEKYLLGEMRILEIGCGTGSLLIELAKRNTRIIGLDLSPQMLKIAAKKLKNLDGKLGLIRAKAENLPFKDGSFDVVFSMFPSQFILYPETIKGIGRVLDLKGTFICLPWVKMKPKTLSSIIQKLIYGRRDPNFHHLIDLAKMENFVTEVREFSDEKGNISFFLILKKVLNSTSLL